GERRARGRSCPRRLAAELPVTPRGGERETLMSRIIILGLSITLSLAVETASAQERTDRVTLDEAVKLAARENPTVRAKEFERQSVAANEITAGLRPNPTATFSGEQFSPGGSSGAATTQ